MVAILSLTTFAALGLTLTYLFLAAFRRPRKRCLKIAGVSFVVFVICLVALPTAEQPTSDRATPDSSIPTITDDTIDAQGGEVAEIAAPIVDPEVVEITEPVLAAAEPPPVAEVEDASESRVRNAYLLCYIFDATDMLSQPCEISGWHSSVDIVIDMHAAEARGICSMLPDIFAQHEINNMEGWVVNIRSPYSGDNNIAYCALD